MSGHSKWSTIKHKKAAKDAKRGKVFTKVIKEITVAARLGGGDPTGNPRLRAALAEAKASSVPNDNIDRAVKKGTGELPGAAYEEITYEGYGPGGVAVLVDAVTDNKNRTVSEIRHLFDRNSGNLAATGSVAWIFRRRGYFAIDPEAMTEERFMELALDIAADDLATDQGVFEIFTTAEDFNRTLEELEKRHIPLMAKELAMQPQNHVELSGSKASAMLRLMDALEEHDDVHKVWANFELDAKVLAAQAP
jgi:YebC/PmpR family DNA-binding regulatory protein